MGKLITDLFADLPLDIDPLPAFREELDSILKHSGIEDDIVDAIDTRLRFLDKYKKQVVHVAPRNMFWKTRGYDGLYEIRFKSRINLRILFTFSDNTHIILLCAFQEKNSEADYKRYCQVANRRLRQL